VKEEGKTWDLNVNQICVIEVSLVRRDGCKRPLLKAEGNNMHEYLE
jgi:hypothetical protein